jgi:inner membrane protein
MPTIITHALVPITIAVVAGRRRIAPPVALLGGLMAILPDADVIGFGLGVAYADTWGHRGALHSLAMAAMITGLIALVWRQARQAWSAAFLFVSMASHGLLDTVTSGGLGIALFWPFDDTRYFAPWRPIRVSPIGVHFFSLRGLETLLSELRWVWLPCGVAIAASLAFRRKVSPRPA